MRAVASAGGMNSGARADGLAPARTRARKREEDRRRADGRREDIGTQKPQGGLCVRRATMRQAPPANLSARPAPHICGSTRLPQKRPRTGRKASRLEQHFLVKRVPLLTSSNEYGWEWLANQEHALALNLSALWYLGNIARGEARRWKGDRCLHAAGSALPAWQNSP